MSENNIEKTLWPISKLQSWDKNPRTVTPENFERLKQQIKKLGQYKPLLITPEGIVIGGNMRLRAYQQLGVEDVWVSIITPNSEKELLEFALSDNDRVGQYNEDLLISLTQNLDIDFDLFAIDLKEPILLSALLDQNKTVVEDEPPAVSDDEPDSVLGSIYQLGSHRLFCGDGTDIAQLTQLTNGQSIDLVFTDPPYNIDYEGKTKKRLKIQNDKKSTTEFYDFLLKSFSAIFEVSKPGATIYICHADSERVNFTNAMRDAGWLQKQCIIWDKGSMVLGRQDYHWEHEPILYGWKEGKTHYFVDDRTQTTIWRIPRPTKSVDHPTMKPISLCARAIKNNSLPGNIVLDTFGGSGSTLIACEQTNRVCYMAELDPRYCDVIRKRYATLIGQEDRWAEVTPGLK